ncbi:MAG: hypothetical protein PVH89_08860, partial [Gammaproteobacteria bacterium]
AVPIVALIAGGEVRAQRTPTFDDESPLELKLTGPFRELGRDPDDRPEHPAVIGFRGTDGQIVELEIEIRIRGNSRVRECRYPPLSLQFKPDDPTGTVFAGQDRLKLVTLCQNSRSYLGYLAQEFMIYRMLNVLTDRSFRVRWATVEYLDTSARRPEPRTAPAFLIEADWEVAERLGLELIETETIDVDAQDAGHLALLSMFQYLIGNTDWSLFEGPPGEDCCHNGKVVGSPAGPMYVIPYDFDNSGLIDAEYAVPAEGLGIRSVTRRLYRGLCRWNDELPAVIAELNRQRENLEAVFDSDLIEERVRRRSLGWLERSFEIINDPEELEEEIYEVCAG